MTSLCRLSTRRKLESSFWGRRNGWMVKDAPSHFVLCLLFLLFSLLFLFPSFFTPPHCLRWYSGNWWFKETGNFVSPSEQKFTYRRYLTLFVYSIQTHETLFIFDAFDKAVIYFSAISITMHLDVVIICTVVTESCVLISREVPHWPHSDRSKYQYQNPLSYSGPYAIEGNRL